MAQKRKLTQDDLRKAMSEHKKKIGAVKKIESPIAKYTDSGQLMCILCKTVVQSETIWPVHLNSRTHKDNVAIAKRTKLQSELPPKLAPSPFKRPASPMQPPAASKKVKGILKNTGHPPIQRQEALPDDFFDIDDKVSNGVATNSAPAFQKLGNVQASADGKEGKNTEEEHENEKDMAKDAAQTVIPEGFFDDPIMDAKVRNVEYKDPIEEEWEKFQKEIKEETAQSAQIIADDQEEATTERQLDEIEEQIRHWSRVMELVKRKEEVQATDRKQDNVDDAVSSGDEAEFDEFLDWRAKNSYK